MGIGGIVQAGGKDHASALGEVSGSSGCCGVHGCWRGGSARGRPAPETLRDPAPDRRSGHASSGDHRRGLAKPHRPARPAADDPGSGIKACIKRPACRFPAGLSRRISTLTTPEQFAALLAEVWPAKPAKPVPAQLWRKLSSRVCSTSVPGHAHADRGQGAEGPGAAPGQPLCGNPHSIELRREGEAVGDPGARARRPRRPRRGQEGRPDRADRRSRHAGA